MHAAYRLIRPVRSGRLGGPGPPARSVPSRSRRVAARGTRRDPHGHAPRRAAYSGCTLRSTNPIESMIEICRDHSTNVKRWRDGQMALRWCAAGCSKPRNSSARSTASCTCRPTRALNAQDAKMTSHPPITIKTWPEQPQDRHRNSTELGTSSARTARPYGGK